MISLRISSNLYWLMLEDLSRPHAFASGRVGFLFVRAGQLKRGESLLLSSEYMPVRDEHYIDDVTVGARINGNAIRMALQKILDTQQGCFHVHRHEHPARACFSSVDRRELKILIPCLQNVGKANCNGALILSQDSACAMAALPGKNRLETSFRIVIVSPPNQIS
jgi:hypothetical protein